MRSYKRMSFHIGLICTLVTFAILGSLPATGTEPLNRLGASFFTFYTFETHEDSFNNGLVEGTKDLWATSMWNEADETGRAISDVNLTLDSALAFDWIIPTPEATEPY